jgi:hypothetical protein
MFAYCTSLLQVSAGANLVSAPSFVANVVLDVRLFESVEHYSHVVLTR